MSKIWIAALIALLVTVNCVSADMVSLAYDDYTAEDGVWINGPMGHAVVFTAPTDNWSLSRAAVLGMLAPESKSELFVVEIWDQNLSLLSRTTDKASSFFSNNFSWALIDIPEVKVSGDFLITFLEFGGVFLGVDTSPSSGRSLIVARSPNRISNWSVQNHTQNQTSWMIHAVGHSPEPELVLDILSDTASEEKPAKIQAKATDPDGNLKSATLYIVDNKTRDIVWAEAKEMKGSSAGAEFSWPAAMSRISANGQDEGVLYVINNPEITENLSSLLAYNAPCIFELDRNINFTAQAYFGEDGQFNALIDAYGFPHYLSQDVLKITRPGVDYETFAKNNITIIKVKSKISFIDMRVPIRQNEQAAELIGPIVLTGSPSTNYDLKLLRSNAGMGEYIAIVKVEDNALNEISRIGDRAIKVK